jgi:hypothetical protein
MRLRLMEWLGNKQRQALGTDAAISTIERRTKEIKKTVRDQRVNELRIAEVSRVNPVYDRIKGNAK